MNRVLAALCGLFFLAYGAAFVFGLPHHHTGLTTAKDSPVVHVSVVTKEGAELGHGTAFYIGNGKFITAGHVAKAVSDTTHLEMVTGAGRHIPVKVDWIDQRRDVALVEAVDTDFAQHTVRAVAKFCNRPDLKVGDFVTSIGYPLNLGLVQAFGRVGSVTHTLSDAEAGAAGHILFIADMTIAPGNSGGPVLDSDGYVAGMSDALPVYPLGMSITTAPFDLIVPRSAICADIAAGGAN